MNKENVDRDLTLANLNDAVSQATTFFLEVEPTFFDGFQTAHEVLAHFVFWHRECVSISQALLLGTKPQLRKASLAVLNELAEDEFRDASMKELCSRFCDLQEKLIFNLRHLPDWEVNFPYKKGCRHAKVPQRVATVEKHINSHMARLRRVQRRGEAWVEAYYLKSTG